MKQFWFVVGSQDLYGEEVLKTVAERAEEMAAWLSEKLPYPLVYSYVLRPDHKGDQGGQL